MKREQGFTPLRCSAESGFTLVEVVVALFIFAMLAAAGVTMLGFAVRAQAASTQRLAGVSDDRRMSALLIADLGQAVARTTRDASGQGRPAFQAKQGNLVLAYVRGGARPQYVEIRLANGQLTRAAAPFADGAVSQTPIVLASNVERAELRFRIEQSWESKWLPTRTDAMPRALELTVTERGKAPLTRRFLVGIPQS